MASFVFDIKNILILLAGILNLIFAITILVKGHKSHTDRWFNILIFSITSWIFSIIFYRGFQEPYSTLVAIRILYMTAATIPLTFLYFTFIFPDEKYSFKFWQKYLIPIPFLAITFMSLVPSYLIKNVIIIPGQEKIIIFNPNLHFIYAIYIIGYFSWSYTNLFKKYLSPLDALTKIQILYVIIGTLLSTTIGVTTNLILPLLGIFTLNWLGQVTVVFMITFIFYAIIKHHLFNVKVIATELLTFAIWIFIFIRLLVDQTLQTRIMEGGLLTLVIFFGILLIRSVIKEVEQREKLETLSRDLAVANEELKQLDAVKSEFISIASHQLRTPLTVIKGYVSLVLEGTLGSISDASKGALDKVTQSTHQLIKLVDDLLNLSRIESGKIQYSFQINNFTEIVPHVIDELDNKTKEKSIIVKLNNKILNLQPFLFDHDKIHEVIMNLIDNAIKYSPSKSVITIALEETEHNAKPYVHFSIQDQGIGIRPEDQKRLFNKFSRSEEARIANPNGMGIGLYFVKRVIEDHGGQVGLLSKGLGKGSTFWVEVPERI